jgi:hypothetical protein
MGGQRGFQVIVGGIVALLIVTVAVVVGRGDLPTATYPAGSPESAFQAYLQAWAAGDDETAYASFSSEVRAATALDSYRNQAGDMRRDQPGTSRRVLIDSATTSGDGATLRISVETTSVSGLAVNRSRATQTVTMIRQDGAWKLDRLWMGTDPWFAEKL